MPFFQVEDPLTGAIHQAQTTRSIESKNGDVDLFHYFAEQCGRFHRAKPLFAQRVTESIHFPQDFAEDVFAVRAAGPDGKVTFAQSGKQVKQRAERRRDTTLW